MVVADSAMQARLELSLRIIDIPLTLPIENNWQEFQAITPEGIVLTVQLKPRFLTRIQTESQNWVSWIAVLKGTLQQELILKVQSVEVYEKRTKQ